MGLRGIAFLVALVACSVVHAGDDERTPFDAVRWTEARPQVAVDGVWYELVAIDGLPRAKVLAACLHLDPDRWERRFCEDLVAALKVVKHTLGETVNLTVRLPGTEKNLELKDVPATTAKRKRVHRERSWVPTEAKRRAAEAAKRVVQRVQREHATTPHADYAFLLRTPAVAKEPRLSQRAAHDDLDQLEWQVEHMYAYRDLRAFDRKAAFDTLRMGIEDTGISKAAFHIQLQKLTALFGDGHARVRGVEDVLPTLALPFRLEMADGRVAALDRDGRPYQGAEYPFLVSISGTPIDAWLAGASHLMAYGSPALRQHMALRVAMFHDFVRAELGVKLDKPSVVLGRSADGKTRVLPLALGRGVHDHRERYQIPPRVLEDGVYYLPIKAMSGSGAWSVRAILAKRDAPGLVLDVRQNGGGSRQILRALLPHLLAADAQPLLCNVASYRLPPETPFDAERGHLRNRSLHPPASSAFTAAERAVAEPAVQRLNKKLGFPREGFTPLHAMVVSPAPKGEGRYLGPIAILIDGGCFSATDIFLGALEQLPNVTLVGTATGGGSGRARVVQLAHSGLRVQLSTMQSFRPDGRRYDGVGIAPDIEARPTLSDAARETDSVLARALEHLKNQRK